MHQYRQPSGTHVEHLFKCAELNCPVHVIIRQLNKRQHRVSLLLRSAIIVCSEDAAPVLPKPTRCIIRIKDWSIVTIGTSTDSDFRLRGGPTLLARSAVGQRHVFVRLVDIKAEDFFFDSTDVTPREALDSVALGPKVDTFHAEAIEASGDRFPRYAALLNRGNQRVSVGALGCTGKHIFSPNGGWGVRQDGQLGLGSNFLELVKSDERVVIIHHTAMLLMQGTNTV